MNLNALESVEMGWNKLELVGEDCSWLEWAGVGWHGLARDGMEWNGMGWNSV